MKKTYFSLVVFFMILCATQVLNHPSIPLVQLQGSHSSRFNTPLRLNSFPLIVAQDPIWNRTYGGPDSDFGYCVIEVSEGGFALCGSTVYAVGPYYRHHFWILRVDANGNLLWNRTFHGPGRDEAFRIIELSTGGFATAGFRSETTGAKDVWVVCVDAAGNHLWNQTFGRPSEDETCYDLIEVSGGGLALAGYLDHDPSNTSRQLDMWLIRLDAAGTHLWNTTYGGLGDDYAQSIIEPSSGGFAILGCTQSFGSNKTDAWLVRTDSAGSLLWNRTYGGNGEDKAHQLIEVHSGGFAFCADTTSFFPISRKDEAWLVQTNSTGHQLWNSTYGGTQDDFVNALVESADGGFALVGHTYSFGAGGMDAWIVRTNASGAFLWNKTYGGTGFEWGHSILELPTGGFIVCGGTDSYGAGHTDLWLLRIPDTAPPTPPELPSFPIEVIVVLVVFLVVLVTIALLHHIRRPK